MSYQHVDYRELREVIQQDMRNTAFMMAVVIFGSISIVMFTLAGH